jgi:hypothetical protein
MWTLIIKFYVESRGGKGNSVSQSSEQAPFTSEIVGTILAMDSCEKSRSMLCGKSLVFSGCSYFLPHGKLTSNNTIYY